MVEGMEPVFFASGAEFNAWLAQNHQSAAEILVGFYKVGTGKPSMTWPESVDEALCYGWIDGVRRSLGEHSYTIRFTPRRKNSIWSAVNLKKVDKLLAEGRMRPAGIQAWEARNPDKCEVYSFEQDSHELSPEFQALFASHVKAWAFFQSQPAGYRRTAIHLVMSAKQEATRLKRLQALIADSEAGLRIAQLRR